MDKEPLKEMPDLELAVLQKELKPLEGLKQHTKERKRFWSDMNEKEWQEERERVRKIQTKHTKRREAGK